MELPGERKFERRSNALLEYRPPFETRRPSSGCRKGR